MKNNGARTSVEPTAGEWNDTLAGDFLWSNANVGEAIPDVMTPLTWDVLRTYWDEWVLIPGYRYLGNIGGRVYTNLSLIASIYTALGKSRAQVFEMFEGLGFLRLPDDMEVPLIPLRKSFVLSLLPQMLGFQLKVRNEQHRSRAFLAGNPAWCDNMRRRVERVETPAKLAELWRREIKPQGIAGFWQTLSVAMYLDQLATPLRRQLTALIGEDDASALLSNLSGEAELASLGLVVGIAQVGRGLLTSQDYVHRYGHRGPLEFELAAPRPAEDPGWLEHQVGAFGATFGEVDRALENQRRTFEAAWGRFETKNPRQARGFRRRIAQAAEVTRRREAIRSEYVRISWAVRAWAQRAAQFTSLSDDVFFLRMDEIVEVLGGDRSSIANVAVRKTAYQKYRSLPPYPAVIKGRFDPFQWAADPQRRGDIYDAHASSAASASDMILGSPGSAGCVEGAVRRLDNLAQADQFQPGEILVTMQTNIGWTPLFPRAKAIITDVGAVLSHAAIVARELGIPAVVGCGDATMRLKTGDYVRVDGGKGIVYILRERGKG